jgi:hypothetical protein
MLDKVKVITVHLHKVVDLRLGEECIATLGLDMFGRIFLSTVLQG